MNSILINTIDRLKKAVAAGALLLLAIPAFAQDYTASGRVIDQQGQPVAGAMINVSEINRPFYTDHEGRFSLDRLKPNDDIVITLEGYLLAAVTVDLTDEMTIVLESDGGKYNRYLSMPFKDIKIKHISGATSTMTGEKLRSHPVSNLENAFMGELTGITTYEPASEPGWNLTQMYIRGLRTYNTNARAPLIIVDDIERDLTFLDAYPIETVTVIKDAATSAIYGMRGTNGVIYVTTKRGTPGKTTIDFTQEVGFQMLPRWPEYQNSYNYALTLNRALYLDGKSLRYTDEEIGYYKMAVDGTLPDNLKTRYYNTNWEKSILRDFTPFNRTNINISGGGKSVRYFTSFSYMRQEGIYSKEWTQYYDDYSTTHRFNRFNLRSNVDIDVTRYLKVSLDLGGRIDNIKQPLSDIYSNFTWLAESLPVWPILNPNGTFAIDQNINKENPAGLLSSSGLDYNRTRNVYSNARAELDLSFLTEGLSIKGLIGFDYHNMFRSAQSQSYFGYYYNPDTGEYTQMRTGTIGLANPSAEAREMEYSLNMMGWLDYTRTFGKHDVNVMAIMRNYRDVTPGFHSSVRYLTYTGIANYIWNDRLSAQVVGTIMGSDNYRKGDRYGFFPAVSVSYNLAEEDFIKDNTDIVSLLKPRASIGRTGQNNIGGNRYPYQSSFVEGGGYNFGTSQAYNQGVYESSAGNENTRWEISEMVNIGMDWDLWNGKLYGSVDVFKEWRSNILVTRSNINALLGIANVSQDAYGRVQSKGIEWVLGHTGRIGKVKYFIEQNVSYSVNKIIDIDEVTPQYSYQAVTGNKLDQAMYYIFEKYFQTAEEIANSPYQLPGTKPGHGKYQDTNDDNVVNELDMVRSYYNVVPEIATGTNIGFEWKGISAKILLVGQFNRTVVMRENVDAGFFWNGKSTKEVLNSWGYFTNDPDDPRNINAKYPRLTTERTHDRDTYGMSNLWYKCGNLLAIRNVELGYALPKHIISKIGMSQLRVYVTGYNLHTFDHIKTLDAENPMNWIWGYPKVRTFAVGINVTF